MTDEQFVETQVRIIEAARILDRLDIEGYLRRIGTAEAVAPIVDPTLYRKAQNNLHALKRLAEKCIPVQAAVRELQSSVLETAVLGHMELNRNEPQEL